MTANSVVEQLYGTDIMRCYSCLFNASWYNNVRRHATCGHANASSSILAVLPIQLAPKHPWHWLIPWSFFGCDEDVFVNTHLACHLTVLQFITYYIANKNLWSFMWPFHDFGVLCAWPIRAFGLSYEHFMTLACYVVVGYLGMSCDHFSFGLSRIYGCYQSLVFIITILIWHFSHYRLHFSTWVSTIFWQIWHHIFELLLFIESFVTL